MHPVMLKVLAAEHVRDMRATATRSDRARDARQARRARRARAAAASAAPFVPQPRPSTECAQAAMEH
jgi:hypothetical protein